MFLTERPGFKSMSPDRIKIIDNPGLTFHKCVALDDSRLLGY